MTQAPARGSRTRLDSSGWTVVVGTFFATSIEGILIFVPLILVLVTIVICTTLEDRTLHHELPGYPECATQTLYRLLPRIW